MPNPTRHLASAALAAATALPLDPVSGRRRRAFLRDQFVSATRHLNEAMGVAARDLAHRTRGMAARARSRFQIGPIDDDKLTIAPR